MMTFRPRSSGARSAPSYSCRYSFLAAIECSSSRNVRSSSSTCTSTPSAVRVLPLYRSKRSRARSATSYRFRLPWLTCFAAMYSPASSTTLRSARRSGWWKRSTASCIHSRLSASAGASWYSASR